MLLTLILSSVFVSQPLPNPVSLGMPRCALPRVAASVQSAISVNTEFDLSLRPPCLTFLRAIQVFGPKLVFLGT